MNPTPKIQGFIIVFTQSQALKTKIFLFGVDINGPLSINLWALSIYQSRKRGTGGRKKETIEYI